MYDVLIAGGGPAGLAAALWLGRCCRRVLVCDGHDPRNLVACHVQGVPTRDGTPPAELRALARLELRRYDVTLEDCRVLDAAREGDAWRVRVADGTDRLARVLVLATGLRDRWPDVEGLARFAGRTVGTCPYCHGWEVRGLPMAVWGWDAAAVELVEALAGWSPEVALLTDGHPAPAGAPGRVETSPLARLEGEGQALHRVVLADGTTLACAMLFVHAGQEQQSDLPVKLGCALDEQGRVRVDDAGRPGPDGLWVCGDASAGTQLVAVAMADGTRVALSIQKALRLAGAPPTWVRGSRS